MSKSNTCLFFLDQIALLNVILALISLLNASLVQMVEFLHQCVIATLRFMTLFFLQMKFVKKQFVLITAKVAKSKKQIVCPAPWGSKIHLNVPAQKDIMMTSIKNNVLHADLINS